LFKHKKPLYVVVERETEKGTGNLNPAIDP
jgi:hypothetical protein